MQLSFKLFKIICTNSTKKMIVTISTYLGVIVTIVDCNLAMKLFGTTIFDFVNGNEY
jgi:hypothetical protein